MKKLQVGDVVWLPNRLYRETADGYSAEPIDGGAPCYRMGDDGSLITIDDTTSHSGACARVSKFFRTARKKLMP